MNVEMNQFGEYLGIRDQNFIVYQDGEESQVIPFHKAKRAVISSGNTVSSSALFWLAQYGVERARLAAVHHAEYQRILEFDSEYGELWFIPLIEGG